MNPAALPLLLVLGAIAARHVYQRARHRALADLRRLFDTAPVGMLVLDEQDRVTHANPSVARTIGCEAHALAGRALAELVHPDDATLLGVGLAEVHHGVIDVLETEIRFLRPAGGAVTMSLHATGLTRRWRRGRRMLVQALDITERKRVEQQLQHLADHDSLTGLLNRRSFERELERHLAHVRRYGAEGAAIVLDVDHFKQVNDTHGHSAGDRLIVDVAQALSERLRTSDVLARLGGDEFAILLPKGDREGAETVARNLVETLHSIAGPDGRAVTISVGVVMFAGHADLTVSSVVVAADFAMYEAKHAGRNGYAFFGERGVLAVTRPAAPSFAA